MGLFWLNYFWFFLFILKCSYCLCAQNELKGETGSPGFKGEKGEPGGGYYDPRYGGVGAPGVPGPPVRSHRLKYNKTFVFFALIWVYIGLYMYVCFFLTFELNFVIFHLT